MQIVFKIFPTAIVLCFVFTSTALAQYSDLPHPELSPRQRPSLGVAQATYRVPTQPTPVSESVSESGFPALVHPTATDQAAAEKSASASKSFGPLVTTGCALAVVLGLFAGLVWLTRRYGNGSMTQTGIPSEVMKSLGSTPIDARTRVTLLRCGNRIIVMAQTATGVHPLSEITDPVEVQRLTAMCNGESVSQVEPTFAEALRHANRNNSAVAFSG